jgi:hypothetical protein
MIKGAETQEPKVSASFSFGNKHRLNLALALALALALPGPLAPRPGRPGRWPLAAPLAPPPPLDAVGCIALQHATPYAKMRRVTPVVYQTTSRLGP